MLYIKDQPLDLYLDSSIILIICIQVVQFMRYIFCKPKIFFVFFCPFLCVCEGNEAPFEQSLSNYITNSCQSSSANRC